MKTPHQSPVGQSLLLVRLLAWFRNVGLWPFRQVFWQLGFTCAALFVWAGSLRGAEMELSLSTLDAWGRPTQRVREGDVFSVVLTARDVRNVAKGLFSVGTDLLYTESLVAPNGPISFSAAFPTLRHVGPSSRGRIEDAFAVVNLNELGATAPQVFTAPFKANMAGAAVFQLGLPSADEDFINALLGRNEPLSAQEVRAFPLSLTVIKNVPGDFDLDAKVDLLDFIALRKSFGNYAACPTCDVNLDQKVDLFDFVVLRKSFGKSAGAAPVPEPRLLPVLLLGLSGWVVLKQKWWTKMGV